MTEHTIDADKLTRVTLVDETGRIFEKYGLSVKLDVQDDGKTLKVFIKSDNPAAAEEAAEALRKDFAKILRRPHKRAPQVIRRSLVDDK